MYSYNGNFEDILETYNQLTEEEKYFICEKELVDLKSNIYRRIYCLDNENCGYIELYKLRDDKSVYLVFALKKQFRGKGIFQRMLNETLEYVKDNNISNKVIWTSNVKNVISEHLAIKNGFIEYTCDGKIKEFYKDI